MAKLTKKGLARYQQIGEKAMYLFTERGYVNTSMDEIARACGCDVANLYNYFTNKEHLLFHVIKAMISAGVETSEDICRIETLSLREKIKAIVYKQMDNRLKLGFTDLYTRFKTELEPSHAREIVSLRDKYDRVLHKLICEGIESGEFKKVDVKLTVITIDAFIERSVVWYSPTGRLSLEEVTDHFCDLLFYGIGLNDSGSKEKPDKGALLTAAINRKIQKDYSQLAGSAAISPGLSKLLQGQL